MPCSRHSRITLPRVTPLKQYSPARGHARRRRARRRSWSRCSSTRSRADRASAPRPRPPRSPRSSAVMRLSRLCELSRMSNMSAGVQRIDEVQALSPRVTIAGFGSLYSATMAIVGLAERVARILIRRGLLAARDHQPQMHAVLHAVRRRACAGSRPSSAARSRPMSSAIFCAPQYSRSRC